MENPLTQEERTLSDTLARVRDELNLKPRRQVKFSKLLSRRERRRLGHERLRETATNANKQNRQQANYAATHEERILENSGRRTGCRNSVRWERTNS